RVDAESGHNEEQHRQQDSPWASPARAGENPPPAVEHLLQVRVHARRREVPAEQETARELLALEQSHQLDVFGDLISHRLVPADLLVGFAANEEELAVGDG